MSSAKRHSKKLCLRPRNMNSYTSASPHNAWSPLTKDHIIMSLSSTSLSTSLARMIKNSRKSFSQLYCEVKVNKINLCMLLQCLFKRLPIALCIPRAINFEMQRRKVFKLFRSFLASHRRLEKNRADKSLCVLPPAYVTPLRGPGWGWLTADGKCKHKQCLFDEWMIPSANPFDYRLLLHYYQWRVCMGTRWKK